MIDKLWYYYWLFYGLSWLEIQYPELAEKR